MKNLFSGYWLTALFRLRSFFIPGLCRLLSDKSSCYISFPGMTCPYQFSTKDNLFCLQSKAMERLSRNEINFSIKSRMMDMRKAVNHPYLIDYPVMEDGMYFRYRRYRVKDRSGTKWLGHCKLCVLFRVKMCFISKQKYFHKLALNTSKISLLLKKYQFLISTLYPNFNSLVYILAPNFDTPQKVANTVAVNFF